MSLPIRSTPLVPGAPSALVSALPWRGVGLVGLLLAEIALVTIRFDTDSLEFSGGWPAELARQSGQFGRIAIAALAALCIFGGPTLRQVSAELTFDAHQPHRFRPLLVAAHLAAFLAFGWVTVYVLEREFSAGIAGGIFVTWVVLGCAVLGSWAWALAPGVAWPSILRRALAPAFLAGLIGLAGWLAGAVTMEIWLPIADWTFAVAEALLRMVAVDVVSNRADFILGTPSFLVEIEPECSGYEGIGLIWLFLGLFLYFYRDRLRFPHALLLLPLGAVAIWSVNAVRIASLIAIGSWVSPDIARGAFHSQAGWLAFNAIALGLVALTSRVGFFAPTREIADRESAVSSTSAAYLAPFLAILAVSMITTALSTPNQSNLLYPLRIAAAMAVLFVFRRVYMSWEWKWSWQGVVLGSLASVAWVLLAPAPETQTASPLASFSGPFSAVPNAIWACLRVVGYVAVVPLAEELAFRGYLTRRLMAADVESLPPGQFSWLSFLVTSILFGILHGAFWLPGIIAGALFALALYRRRQLGDAVIAHATANALLAVYAGVTGNWHLWS